MFYLFVKYIIGPFILLFWRPIVYGKEHLRVKGKAILVANHRSMADPLLLALISPRVIHFMAKKEIFETWIGNLFFRLLFAFPVDRKTADIASLKSAMQLLKEGKVFGIFPEGKRAITHDLDALERGAAFLAIRSGAPLIPVYIHPESYRRCRPILMVGRALDVRNIAAGAKKSELVEVVTDEIAGAISALREEMEAILC